MKSVCGVGGRASEARQEFTGQHVPRRMDGSARAGPRLGDKGEGQGSSSVGIHTEDVEIDIVRGEQSFLHFFLLAKDSTRQNHRSRDCKHTANSEH